MPSPRRLLTIFLLGASLGGCTGGSPHAAPRAPASASDAVSSAQALLDTALASARASKSVHYVLSTPQKVGPASTTIGDVAENNGRQQILDPNGGRVTTVLIGTTCYFKGNTLGLVGVGYPPSISRELNGHWRRVPSTSAIFAAATDQVTLASVLSYITPTGALTERGPEQAFGRHVVEVTGGIPRALLGGQAKGSTILYLTADAEHLPVAFDFIGPGSLGTERWVFSSWGEPVTVAPPASSSS